MLRGVALRCLDTGLALLLLGKDTDVGTGVGAGTGASTGTNILGWHGGRAY